MSDIDMPRQTKPDRVGSVTQDERAERIRSEILKTIVGSDIEMASRDPLKAEAAEQRAYQILNAADSKRDSAEYENMLSEARALFRDSFWVSSLIKLDLARQQGMTDEDACGKIAEELRTRAREDRRNIPREVWLALNSTARRFEHQQEHADLYDEIRGLAKELRSDNPSPEAQKKLRTIILAARGAYVRNNDIQNVLQAYGLEQYEPIIDDLARAWRRTVGWKTDKEGEDPLGSGEVYSSNTQEVGGFAGATRKSRPRRDPSGGSGESF